MSNDDGHTSEGICLVEKHLVEVPEDPITETAFVSVFFEHYVEGETVGPCACDRVSRKRIPLGGHAARPDNARASA